MKAITFLFRIFLICFSLNISINTFEEYPKFWESMDTDQDIALWFPNLISLINVNWGHRIDSTWWNPLRMYSMERTVYDLHWFILLSLGLKCSDSSYEPWAAMEWRISRHTHSASKMLPLDSSLGLVLMFDAATCPVIWCTPPSIIWLCNVFLGKIFCFLLHAISLA